MPYLFGVLLVILDISMPRSGPYLDASPRLGSTPQSPQERGDSMDVSDKGCTSLDHRASKGCAMHQDMPIIKCNVVVGSVTAPFLRFLKMEPAIKAGNLQAMRPCLKFGIFTCFKCKYHLLSCRTQRLSIDMFYLSNTDTYEGSRFKFPPNVRLFHLTGHMGKHVAGSWNRGFL